MITDQYDDKSLQTYMKLASVIVMPEFVKTASVANIDDVRSLPSDAFADSTNRKFPLHTKHDTYLSAAYFSKVAGEYDPVKREQVVSNINNAMHVWGIPGLEVKPRSDNTLNKQASWDEPSLTVMVKTASGEEIDKWELRNPRDFEKAAIQLFNNKNLFTFEQRKDISRQMLSSDMAKKANLDTDTYAYLEKAAGFGMCTKGQFMDALKDRARLYARVDDNYSEHLMKFATEVEQPDFELTCQYLQKVATVLDTFDRATAISTKYDIPTAEESLFLLTEKIAAEAVANTVHLQNGAIIDKSEITEDAVDSFFDKYLGEVPSVGFDEKLDILETLPIPDADAFEEHLKG